MEKYMISKADLLHALGPAPTVQQVGIFLREGPGAIYKKLACGQLERLPGLGVLKISIPSLLRYLNGGQVHVTLNPNKNKGRPKRHKVSEVAA